MGNYEKLVPSSNQNDSLPIGDNENPKKPTKAVVTPNSSPRTEKILSEKNACFNSHLRKPPNFESRASFGGEFSENVENFNPVDDLKSSPYDPLTNYLSPRPKFLRYKPDRYREVLLRLENEIKEGRNALISGSRTESIDSLESNKETNLEGDLMGSSFISLSGSSTEGNVKVVESEEIEESSDEFEEIYEEDGSSCWDLRGILKFLLVLVVLVVSASCISSINSPTSSSLILQSVSSIEDGYYHMIRNNVDGLVRSFKCGGYSGEVGEFEKNNEVVGNVHSGEIEGAEMCKDGEFIDYGQRDPVEIVENAEAKEEVDELVRFAELENEESSGPYDEVANGLDQLQMELLEIEGAEMCKDGEFIDYGRRDPVEIIENAEVKEEVDELVRFAELENEESSGPYDEVANGLDQLQMELLEDDDNETSDVMNAIEKDNGLVIEDVTDIDIAQIEEDNGLLIERAKQDTTDNGMDRNRNVAIDSNEDESVFKATAIGFSVLFSLIGSSILTVVHFKKRRNGRNDSSDAGSPPVIKPCTERFVTKRSSTVLASEEGEYKQWLEVLSNTNSLIESKEEEEQEKEDLKAMNQSRAPSVELLGEFVVGEVSNSLRSYGVKSRMELDSEVSSHSVSFEKAVSDSKAHSVGVNLQPTFSAMSALNSPSLSYEKRTAKKKELVATPVRRSSRIRNRTTPPP